MLLVRSTVQIFDVDVEANKQLLKLKEITVI